MNVDIIYEDADVVVIDKPPGVTVNRAETTKNKVTIQDWMEERYGIQYKVPSIKYDHKDWKPELDFNARGGVVHRLDKETSGILVLAKTPPAFAALQKQFKDRSVKKVYIALAHGRIMPPEGEISVPVGRLPWNRNRFGILPGGRESKTLYKVLHEYTDPETQEILTLVELYPQSGRTHQIRVHLKYIGNPIFSDFLYAGRKTAKNDRKRLERVFLHAAKITFQQPSNNKELSLTAPLSPNLSQFLQQLK